jgi:hypothetical protein
MGNYIFTVPNPPPNGAVVVIHDDQFSKDNEIPADLLRRGQQAKVLKTINLYQSRGGGNPITVTKVQLKNGMTEAYLTTNIN